MHENHVKLIYRLKWILPFTAEFVIAKKDKNPLVSLVFAKSYFVM